MDLYYYKTNNELPTYHTICAKLITYYICIVLSFLSLEAIIECGTYLSNKVH